MISRHRISAVRVLVTTLLTIPLLLPAAIAVAPAAPTRADELAARIAASRQRQQELLRSIDRNKDLVEQLRADQDLADNALDGSASRLDGINIDQAAVREQVQAATDALRRVQARHDTLVAELAELDWTMTLLESQMAQGEEDLEARRSQLGERLAEAYRTGQTTLLEQVLDSSSFTDVLTGVDAHLRFGDQDVELAKAIQADQAELDSLRRLTAATRYNTDQLRLQTIAAEEDLALRRERLKAAQDRLTAVEAETRRLLQQQRDEYARISSDKADAAAEVAAHEAAAGGRRGRSLPGLRLLAVALL
jgi:peptidoglycan hydrolase CwlO-like protein